MPVYRKRKYVIRRTYKRRVMRRPMIKKRRFKSKARRGNNLKIISKVVTPNGEASQFDPATSIFTPNIQTMVVSDLPYPLPAGSVNTVVNRRQNVDCMLQKIHIDRSFVHLKPFGQVISGPIFVRWMLLQSTGTESSSSTLSSNAKFNFFKDFKNDISDTKAFSDALVGDIWNDRYITQPVNRSNALHKILAMKTFRLNTVTPQSEAMGNNRHRIQKTFTINRKIGFDLLGNVRPNNPIFEAYYYTAMDARGFEPVATQMGSWSNNIVFYKDTN